MKNIANIGAAAQPMTKIVLSRLERQSGGKDDGQKSGAAVILLLHFRIKDRIDEFYTPKRHSWQLFICVKVMQGLR